MASQFDGSNELLIMALADKRPVILLVDDDPHDVVLLRLAFRKVGIIDTIRLVNNGGEAMGYLKGEGRYANRQLHPMATLILLDLRMPQTSGFEVLRWIRQQPELNTLLVVVMSSSTDEKDVENAYQLGANLYLVKPAKFSDLVKMTGSLKEFHSAHLEQEKSASISSSSVRMECEGPDRKSKTPSQE